MEKNSILWGLQLVEAIIYYYYYYGIGCSALCKLLSSFSFPCLPAHALLIETIVCKEKDHTLTQVLNNIVALEIYIGKI